MKKLLIALTLLFPTGVYAVLVSPYECCIAQAFNTCEDFECTYEGTTRYYTSCGTCKNSLHTLTMGGPYKPCGTNGGTLDASYGECVQQSIIIDNECEAGTYGTRLCQLCPDPGTSTKGSKLITDCHIPAGSGNTDPTGKWEYNADCHYSN